MSEGRTIAEIRSIVKAELERFDELAELWQELTEAEQLELVATAREMAQV